MLASTRSIVRCRPIKDDDIDALADCLTRGFPMRARTYWLDGLRLMASRAPVADYPKFGYCLECDGRIVGVLLQIYSRRGGAESTEILCNLSSWCVDEDYRAYALALQASALKRKEVTYINISPAEHTRRGIEASGFKRINQGQMIFAPLLSAHRADTRVLAYRADAPAVALLAEDDRKLLAEHAALGCRVLIGLRSDRVYGYVFTKGRILRERIACEQLIFCTDRGALPDFAGAIGRHLLARGILFCVVDANEPIAGLVGRYCAERGPKYYKGPSSRLLGDLAYSELVILGR